MPALPGERELQRAIFLALRKAILFAAGLYVLYQFLGAVTFVVLFFSVVILLAAVLNPIVAWLQRRRVPRSVSAAFLGLLVIAAVVNGIWYGVPPLLDQGQELVRQAPELYDNLRERAVLSLAKRPELARQVPPWDELLRRAAPYASHVAGQLGRYTLNVVSGAVLGVLLIMLVLYSLASPQPLVTGLLALMPERSRPRAEHILGLILARLKTWALGTLLLGVIVGGLTGIGLYALNVPFALVFAVVTAFGEFLPNLGPVLSAIPPMLVALSVDPMTALWVAVLFIAIHQLENALLVPLVMSRTLDLHPLSVAFMMLAMGATSGIVGALLAVPATVVIKTLYEELYLTEQVSDPGALEAQSERVVSDGAGEIVPEASSPDPSKKIPDNLFQK
jgi:predicted PurR-regulated permease PerM